MTGGWTGVWPASGVSVPAGGGGGVGAADGAAVAEEFWPGALVEFVPGAEDPLEGGTAEGGVRPVRSAIIITRLTAMTTRTIAATTTATRRRTLPEVAVDTAQ
ncbi:hypothetical protein J2W15_003189 [Pseudarthrobacter sulfonivorans]|nr:hypothetical protein [Pseudarthrobacter sulfonivorans]